MNRATIDDVLIVAGVMLIGASMLWWAGWPGLLGYAGALLLVLGVALARR